MKEDSNITQIPDRKEVSLNPRWFERDLDGSISDNTFMDSLNNLSRKLHTIGLLLVFAEQSCNEVNSGDVVASVGDMLVDLHGELDALTEEWHKGRKK